MMTKQVTKQLFVAVSLATVAWAAQAQADINISIGGIIKPGVYGRVDVGTRPPPAVIYPQPVIIAQPAVIVAQQQPIYLHVPPGHAKKWDKHCYKYNACNQQVFFVKNDYREYEEERGKKHKNKKNKHDD
jgi:hypothetical protein